MIKTKYFILLFSLMVIAHGCQKDEIGVTNTTVIETGPVETIQTSVSGLVTDEDGNPLSDVTVQYRADFIQTDENGYFKVKDAAAAYDGGLLKFAHEGYFKNFKWFYPQLGDNSFVRVIMVTEKLVGTISAAEGGVVSLNGGASVTFPPSAFENASGDLKIYGHWFDPSGEKLAEEMPGDLRGIDTENALVQLATYGMVAVEIRDTDNNDIQLKEGVTAAVEFPLSADLAENAAQTIKTWSFDEDRAYWLEEGSATLIENKYVAEVSHFSFWNCDAPFPVVHIKGRLVDKNGTPIVRVKICITDLSRSITRTGWTSADGVFSGKIPKNAPLKFIAKDECRGELYSGEIGPFSEDIDLGDIVADDVGLVTISGVLVCDGAPMTNGYALLSLADGTQFVAEPDDQGQFAFNLPFCKIEKISIKGFNLDDYSTSEWQIFTDFESTIDVGNIELCDGTILSEYFDWKMAGGGNELKTLIESAEGFIRDNVLTLQSSDQNSNITIEITDPFLGPGNTVLEFQSTIRSGSDVKYSWCDSNGNPGCGLDLELTVFESTLGTYIEGTFMGMVMGEINPENEVMGTFRVKLDEIITSSTITGVFWEDVDNNGIRDAGETIPDNRSITVTLLNQGLRIATTTTDSEGKYLINAPDNATYTISFFKPAGYRYTLQDVGSDDTDSDADPITGMTEEFTTDGTTEYKYDVGLFFDNSINCDSIQTNNPSCGNNNGSYSLYSFEQDSLNWDGYVLETQLDGNVILSTPYIPWDRVTELTAGAYTYTLFDAQGDVTCTGDFILEDTELKCNVDGIVRCNDSAFTGIVEIWCPDSNPNFQPTLEWENGQTGNVIDFVTPDIYTVTITDNNGCTGEFNLDFSDVPESSIGGTVWIDSIIGNPGIYDANFEKTYGGALIELYDINGTLLFTTTSDTNGNYLFTGLEIGTEYVLSIAVPTEYELVALIDPTDPDFRSDSVIDPVTILSDPITIEECGDYINRLIGLQPK